MNKLKWISFGIVGSLFAVSHIGMIGYIATREKSKLPNINVPVGPYTSYKVSVSEEGYAISYKANDPKTAYITKDIKEKADSWDYQTTQLKSLKNTLWMVRLTKEALFLIIDLG